MDGRTNGTTAQKRKIVIPGGTGQTGTLLARAFHAEGHEVVVLSRTPQAAPWRVVLWDAESLGEWAGEMDGADAVINLAGRSVNCRYTPENRQVIMDSRVLSTRTVGEAIAKASDPPRVWLQASTATIYSHRHDAPNDEVSGILGGAEPGLPETWRFSLDVARQWEAALEQVTTPRTRKTALRTSIVMSADKGGAFDTLLNLVRRGLGGTEGDGRQFVSWIHGDDFVRAVRFLLDADSLAGPVILAAPGPLPNADFLRDLRAAAGVSAGLPATAWMLEIGARALGTETELILKSRYVVPRRLTEAGFTFEYPAWPQAARDLCRRGREAGGGSAA